jgi:hypothetical protein
MIDSEIGYIADFIPDRIVTSEGIAVFIGVGAVFGIGGYLVLSSIRKKNKEGEIMRLNLRIMHAGVSITHYALIGMIAIVIIQMLVFAWYSTFSLYAVYSISYGVWIVTLALLARAFLKWYRSSNKNTMVLVFALSMIAYVVNGLTGLANYVEWLQLQPDVITSDWVAFFPSFELDSAQQQINLIYQIAAVASYVLTWIGTVMLLRPYIHRIGKTKFYSILGASMVYYLISYPLFVLGYFTPTEENDVEVMNNIVITGIATVLSGVIFGAAFLSVARTLQKDSSVREWMMMAAYGFILFYVAGSASAAQAAYPPFGLASVAFTGLACYMIYSGLYSGAVTVSQDVALRRSIRKSLMEQSKFLDNIGTAEMERELRTRVVSIAKRASDEMIENSGVEASMTEDDMREYMDQVLKELESKKEKRSS